MEARRPKIVGITGGIGVGKSYVLQAIQAAGYPTYQADLRAKVLMERDPELRAAILAEFGPEAYAGGQLNRGYLASVIFAQPERRARLNALVHPRTLQDFQAWVQARMQEGHPALFKEAALTIEAQAYEGLDALVLVYAPMQVRLRRLSQRDKLPLSALLERMRSQWPEWKKLPFAQYLLVNDGKLPLQPQLQALFVFLALPFPR